MTFCDCSRGLAFRFSEPILTRTAVFTSGDELSSMLNLGSSSSLRGTDSARIFSGLSMPNSSAITEPMSLGPVGVSSPPDMTSAFSEFIRFGGVTMRARGGSLLLTWRVRVSSSEVGKGVVGV